MQSSYPRLLARSYYVLLDYYNIQTIHRQRGAAWVVQRVFDTLGTAALVHAARFRIRFYGGWYGKTALTQQGQTLSAELAGVFPARLSVGTRYTSLQLRVGAELASSMLADPSHDVLHTLRRGTPFRSNIHPIPFRGCTEPTACPLAPIEALFDLNGCPADGCLAPVSAVFSRPKKQKLVDTMLVSDLIYLACTTPNPVVVVSTDDDLWPGIRTALHLGLPVHHVHTDNRTTPRIYASAVTTAYHEYRL